MSKLERYGYPIFLEYISGDVGYIGYVNGEEILFETEDDYNDYMNELEKEEA